jgi:hypothetical protein
LNRRRAGVGTHGGRRYDVGTNRAWRSSAASRSRRSPVHHELAPEHRREQHVEGHPGELVLEVEAVAVGPPVAPAPDLLDHPVGVAVDALAGERRPERFALSLPLLALDGE